MTAQLSRFHGPLQQIRLSGLIKGPKRPITTRLGVFPGELWLSSSAKEQEAQVPVETGNSSVIDVDASPELPQAPNRTGIWAQSQQSRSQAMAGPRFEQTDFAVQVRWQFISFESSQ